MPQHPDRQDRLERFKESRRRRSALNAFREKRSPAGRRREYLADIERQVDEAAEASYGDQEALREGIAEAVTRVKGWKPSDVERDAQDVPGLRGEPRRRRTDMAGRRQAAGAVAKGATQTLTGIPKFLSGLRPRRRLPDHQERIEAQIELEEGMTPVERRRMRRQFNREIARDQAEADPVSEGALYRLGTALDEMVEERFPDEPGLEEDFWLSKVPHGFGSTLGFMAGGFGSAGARALLTRGAVASSKRAGAASAGAMGASVTGAEQYEDALRHGADEYTARTAMFAGAGPGVIEALPVMGAIGRFTPKATPLFQGMLAKNLTDATKGAVEEAIQEGLQNVGANAIARALYDSDRELADGLVEATEIGGIVGGGMNFLTSFVSSMLGVRLRPDSPNYDPYGILGVKETAEWDEIEQAAADRMQRLGIKWTERGTVAPESNVDEQAITTMENMFDALQVISEERALEEAIAEMEAEQEAAAEAEAVEGEPDTERLAEAVEAAGEPIDTPLEDRGERVSRTEAEMKETIEGGREITVPVYLEEYEDRSRVTRSREGDILAEIPPPEETDDARETPEAGEDREAEADGASTEQPGEERPEPQERPTDEGEGAEGQDLPSLIADLPDSEAKTEMEAELKRLQDIMAGPAEEYDQAEIRKGTDALRQRVAEQQKAAPAEVDEEPAISPKVRKHVTGQLTTAQQAFVERGDGADISEEDVDNLVGDAMIDLEAGDLSAAQDKLDQIMRETPPDVTDPTTTPPGYFEDMGPTQAYRKFQAVFEGDFDVPTIRDALLQGGVKTKSATSLLTGIHQLRRRDRLAEEKKTAAKEADTKAAAEIQALEDEMAGLSEAAQGNTFAVGQLEGAQVALTAAKGGGRLRPSQIETARNRIKAAKEALQPAQESTTFEGKPRSLGGKGKSRVWGARVEHTPGQDRPKVGDVVKKTTKKGKTWDERVTEVVREASDHTVVRTERIEEEDAGDRTGEPETPRPEAAPTATGEGQAEGVPGTADEGRQPGVPEDREAAGEPGPRPDTRGEGGRGADREGRAVTGDGMALVSPISGKPGEYTTEAITEIPNRQLRTNEHIRIPEGTVALKSREAVRNYPQHKYGATRDDGTSAGSAATIEEALALLRSPPAVTSEWDGDTLVENGEPVGSLRFHTIEQGKWGPDEQLKARIMRHLEEDYDRQGLPPGIDMEGIYTQFLGSMLYDTQLQAQRGIQGLLYGKKNLPPLPETVQEDKQGRIRVDDDGTVLVDGVGVGMATLLESGLWFFGNTGPNVTARVPGLPHSFDRKTREELLAEIDRVLGDQDLTTMRGQPLPDTQEKPAPTSPKAEPEPVAETEPKPVKQPAIERGEIADRSDEDQVRTFAEGFYHLDAYGVTGVTFMAEAAALLREAERIGQAEKFGDLLEQVAESVRKKDPTLYETGAGRALNIAIRNEAKGKQILRVLTQKLGQWRADEELFGYARESDHLGDFDIDDFLDSMGDDEDMQVSDDHLSEDEKTRIKEEEEEGQVRSTPQPGNVVGRNYRLDPETIADLGTPLTRAKQNVAAIKLVKKLIDEQRDATRDEQDTLVRFVGWGGLKAVFKKKPVYEMGQIQKQLRELLTDQEYATAERSSQYAHYTHTDMIQEMYEALRRMGVRGRVEALEPGAGVGHFIGLSPLRARWTAIEMDEMTAAILGKLYPQSRRKTVHDSDTIGERYEDAVIPNQSMDVAIGNPPFAKHRKRYGDRKHSMHDFFIIKSLDKLRPGGILAMITSTYTLSKVSDKSRQEMAKHANFLGAVKLPSTAFVDNAKTSVTTDIVFFQKRDPGTLAQHADPEWFGTTTVDHTEVTQDYWRNRIETPMKLRLNRYFQNNPDMMLGTLKRNTLVPAKRDHHGNLDNQVQEAALDPKRDTTLTLKEQLHDALVKMLPEDIYEPSYAPRPAPEAVDRLAGIKPGQFVVRRRKGGNQVFKREGDRLVPVEGINNILTPKGNISPKKKGTLERVVKLIRIAEAHQEVLTATREWVDEANLKKAQRKLNRLYNAFVKKHGAINKQEVVETRRKPVFSKLKEDDWVVVTNRHADLPYESSGRIVAIDEKAKTFTVVDQETGQSADLNISDVKVQNQRIRYPNLMGYTDQARKARVASLDRLDPATQSYVKADIFSKRLFGAPQEITSTEEPWEGVQASLRKHGTIDMAYVRDLTGKTEKQLIRALEGKVFRDPVDNSFQLASDYLSGNVRVALALAKEAAERDASYQVNVKALEEVQPERIRASTIRKAGGAQIGSTWVPTDHYTQFAADALGMDLAIEYRVVDGAYRVRQAAQGPDFILSETLYEQFSVTNYQRLNGGDAKAILAKLMKGNMPRVTRTVEYTDDRGRTRTRQVKDERGTAEAVRIAATMQGTFEDWLLSDDAARATAMTDLWNENMNHSVAPTFDGTFLDGHIKGVTDEFRGRKFSFREHQLNAIWRIISKGNTMLMHATGSGKTFIMAGAAMLSKQIGSARKPMIVVPNAILNQFAGEFTELFPEASILVADAEKMREGNRQQLFADVAASDWDAVLVPRSQFTNLTTSPQVQITYLQGLVSEFREAVTAAGDDRMTVRDLQGRIEAYEEKIRELMEFMKTMDKDDLFFEDLGVDMVFVDEAHDYKNLSLPTASSQLKNIDESKRATKLHLIAQHLQSINPGRGLVLSTATPISNDVGELYRMLRYLAEPELRRIGYGTMDAWAHDYVASWAEMDYNDVGQLEEVYRPRAYANPYSLKLLWRQWVDVIQNKDLAFGVPKLVDEDGEEVDMPTPVVVEFAPGKADPRMISLMQLNLSRWETIKSMGQEMARQMLGETFFGVMWDGRKASLDERLVVTQVARDNLGPSRPFEAAKVDVASQRLLKFLNDTKDIRATAMVFAEFGVEPLGVKGYSFYEDMKDKLVQGGIPANEIAFIRDAKDAHEKQEMINKMNRGDIRVMFGTSENLGTGVNAQKRLGYLIHMDAPWRPMDIQQREGRIIRQGNELVEDDLLPGVRIDRMVMRGSYDAKIWNVLERKIRPVEQLMNATPTTGLIEIPAAGMSTGDVYAIVKGTAAANPFASDLEKAKADLTVLRAKRDNYDERRDRQAEQLIRAQERLEYLTGYKDWIDRDAEMIEKNIGQGGRGKFKAITVSGKVYTDYVEAKTALHKSLRNLADYAERTKKRSAKDTVASYGGLDVELVVERMLMNRTHHLNAVLHGVNEGEFEKVTSYGTRLTETKERPDLYQTMYRTNGKTMESSNWEKEWDPLRTIMMLGRRVVAQAEEMPGKIKRAERELKLLQAEVDKPFIDAARLTQVREDVERLTRLFNEHIPEDVAPAPQTDQDMGEAREDIGGYNDPKLNAINAVHKENAVQTYGSVEAQVEVASGVAQRAGMMAKFEGLVSKVGTSSMMGGLGIGTATGLLSMQAFFALPGAQGLIAGLAVGFGQAALGATGFSMWRNSSRRLREMKKFEEENLPGVSPDAKKLAGEVATVMKRDGFDMSAADMEWLQTLIEGYALDELELFGDSDGRDSDLEDAFAELEEEIAERLKIEESNRRKAMREAVRSDKTFMASMRRKSDRAFVRAFAAPYNVRYLLGDDANVKRFVKQAMGQSSLEVRGRTRGQQQFGTLNRDQDTWMPAGVDLGDRFVNPRRWLQERRDRAIELETQRRLSVQDGEFTARDVAAATVGAMATALRGANAVTPDPLWRPRDTTNPALRRQLVDGTAKPFFAWTDITGQRIASAEDAFRILREFGRSKQQETFHFIGVDSEGMVQFHNAVSSGAANYVALRRDHYDHLLDLVNHSGVSQVYLVHNHPSGFATPSQTDHQLWQKFDQSFQDDARLGRVSGDVTLTSVVINSDHFSVYDGDNTETVTLGDLPSDPMYEVVRNSTSAAMLFHRLQVDEGSMHILYRDAARQAVAVEPVPSSYRPSGGELQERMRQYGAVTAVFGVKGDELVDQVATHLESENITNPAGTSPGTVIDVLNIDSAQPWSVRKVGRRKLKPTAPIENRLSNKAVYVHFATALEDVGEYEADESPDPEPATTEHGDWRKANQRVKDRADRIAAALVRLDNFREDYLDSKADEVTGEVLAEALAVLTETTIPAKAKELLAKAKEAEKIGPLLWVVSQARVEFRNQLKRYHVVELKAALRGAKVPKMHPEYLEQLRGVLRKYNVRPLVDKATLRKLRIDAKKSVHSLSPGELKALVSRVRQIAHAHATHRNLVGQRKREAIAEVSEKVVSEATSRVEVLKRGAAVGKLGRLASGAARQLEGRQKKTSVGRFLSNFSVRPADLMEDLSPLLRRLAYDDVTIKGYHDESTLLYGFIDPIKRAASVASGAKVHTREFERWRTQAFEFNGTEITRGEAIQLYLTMLDPTNAALILKHGITLDRSRKGIRLDGGFRKKKDRDRRRAAVRKSYQDLKEIIGDEGKHLAQSAFEIFNGPMKDALNKAWVSVYGYEIADVVSYVPRKVDMREMDPKNDPLTLLDAPHDPNVTTWGHLKSRIGAGQPLRIGDVMQSFASHAAHVARISAYLVPVNNVYKVLGQPEVRKALEARAGERGYQRIMESVKAQSVKYYDREEGERTARRFRRNAAIAILGLRPSTWFLNPSGLAITAGVEALHGNDGYQWLVEALPSGMNPSEWRRIRALALTYAPYWRQRYEGSFLNEVTAGLAGEAAYSFGPPSAGEHSLVPLQYSDMFGAVVRWKMAEIKVAENSELEAGSDEYHTEVAHEWMRMMFSGENSSHGGDLSGDLALGHRNVFYGFMSMFRSSVMRIYSLLWSSQRAAVRKGGDRKAAAAGFAGVFASLAWATGVRIVLDMIGDDDDEEGIDIADKVGRFMGEAAGTLPLVGNIVIPTVNAALRGGSRVYSTSVLEDAFQDAAEVLRGTYTVTRQLVNQELDPDWEPAWRSRVTRVADGAVGVLAMWRGFPWDGPKDMVNWVYRGEAGSVSLDDGSEPVTQENRKLGRAIDRGDNALYREAVRELQAAGISVDDEYGERVVNRKFGRYTKFEGGKPAREQLTAMALQDVDSKLDHRDELRQSAAALARMNSDLLDRGSGGGRQRREMRPGRAMRERRDRR